VQRHHRDRVAEPLEGPLPRRGNHHARLGVRAGAGVERVGVERVGVEGVGVERVGDGDGGQDLAGCGDVGQAGGEVDRGPVAVAVADDHHPVGQATPGRGRQVREALHQGEGDSAGFSGGR
jgi:hypothetical protein